MSVDPAKVIRIKPPIGTVWDVARNRDYTTGVGRYTDRDLHLTTDRPGLWRGWSMIAGLPVDHGTVADESAMLALHTFGAAAGDTPLPRCVVPGDTCTRADLGAGYLCLCISGNGTLAADWRIVALKATTDALAVELATKIGSAVLDGYYTSDQTDALLDDKQDALTNAAALARITSAGAGQPPLWDGATWPGGGGSTQTAHDLIMSAGPIAYYTAAAVLDGSGNAVSDGVDIAQATDLSGNGNHWVAPSGARPTFDADGCGGHPCIAFGGAAYITCATGAVDLREHTIILVARSRATTNYGRLLVVGLPASGQDYTVATAEVITCDNTGDSEIRLNSGGANYAISLASTDIGRPAGWGVYIYRISRPPATSTARARLSLNGGVVSATATTGYPSTATGIHAGCQWANGSAQPATDVYRGDIARLAVLPRGMPDGWCDVLAARLLAELGI